MPQSLTRLVSELHRFAEPAAGDAELLASFAAQRDEAAFQTLVERHGPMVLRLCRRVLGDAHAAEDACQATFLVLARKAGTLQRPVSLAGWLYGVAQRIALKARRGCCPPLPTGEPTDRAADPLAALSARELLVALEEELARLPEPHRMAVVACCLEGHSREEAAARLGCTVGALRGWLERGRARLHTRLVKRGLTLGAVLAAAEVVHGSAAVVVSCNAASGEALRLAAAVLRGGALLKVPMVLLTLILGAGALWLVAAGTSVDEQPKQAVLPVAPAGQGGQVDREGERLPAEALARIGSLRLRHAAPLNTVLYTADGNSIASFDEDGYVCFWDATTGRLRRRLDVSGLPSREPKPGRAFRARGTCILQSDGKKLVLFDERMVKVIDAETGKVLHSFRPQSMERLLQPSFDRAGSVLVANQRNSVVVFDVAAGAERLRIPVEGEVIESALVSPNGKTVAVGAVNSGTVLLYDAQTGKLRRRLDGPKNSAGPIAFAPDGKWLLTGPFEPRLWNLDEAGGAQRVEAGNVRYNAVTHCAAFSPDGKWVAVAGYGPILITELPSGKELRRLPAFGTHSLAFAADGVTLLVGGQGGEISQWDVPTGRLRDASADPFPQARDLLFLDEKRLQLSAHRYEVWDWQAGTVLQRFPVVDARAAADVSRDGQWLAHAAAKGKLALLQLPKATPRWLDAHLEACLAVRFTPDGRTLFSTGWDRRVRGWDIATGQLRHDWQDDGEPRNVLVVSPDGRWLVTAATSYYRKPDPSFRIWDIAANRLAHTIVPEGVSFLAFAFSADGKRLAAAGGSGTFDPNTPGQIIVFDTTSGQQLATMTGPPRPITTLAFSPDGRCVAGADANSDRTVAFHYWELATRMERHRFAGQTSRVHSLAFSPSGALLAAASPDAPAYIWDVYGRQTNAPPQPWSTKEAEQIWHTLGSADAAVGFQTLRRLIRTPGPAVTIMHARLKPAKPVDGKRLKQGLVELDAEDFTVRQAAFAALEQMDERIEGPLQQALAGGRSLEAKRRIEALLAKLRAPTPERLASDRCLEALEQIATPDAIRLLEALAAGEPAARLTREATAARERLRRRGG